MISSKGIFYRDKKTRLTDKKHLIRMLHTSPRHFHLKNYLKKRYIINRVTNIPPYVPLEVQNESLCHA